MAEWYRWHYTGYQDFPRSVFPSVNAAVQAMYRWRDRQIDMYGEGTNLQPAQRLDEELYVWGCPELHIYPTRAAARRGGGAASYYPIYEATAEAAAEDDGGY